MNKLTRIALLGLGLAAISYAGCKQGRGDRCQVVEDCQDGLFCNTATHVCQGAGGTEQDASIIDGPIKMDAGIDAHVDAPPDAFIPGDI